MIRIIHIGKPLAGVGVHMKLIIRNLDALQFKNEVILNSNDNNIALLNKVQQPIKTYHANLKRSIHFYNDFKTFVQIYRIVKKSKPDILHCHSAKAGLLGRLVGFLLGIPTFYTPNAYSFLSVSGFKKRVYKTIEKWFSYLPAITIACSQSEYDRAIYDLNIPKNKVKLWNNSIQDVLTVSYNVTSYKLPVTYICSVGRPSFQKNTALLIKSIQLAKKKHPNIHLVILGVGFYSPELDRINSVIKNNNLDKNITLIPWIEREASLQILRNSVFYISTSRYEGMPYAVLEAMALQKACILTNVDGNKDLVIPNENGFLVEENPEEIANTISYLLQKKDIRDSMEKSSRNLFEKFYLIDKKITSLENIYLQYYRK